MNIAIRLCTYQGQNQDDKPPGCQNKIFRVELVAFHFYDASLIYRAKRFQVNIYM